MAKLSKEFDIIKKWRNSQVDILLSLHPELDRSEVNKIVDRIIDRETINPTVTIHNSYVGKHLNDSLLGVTNWINRSKPVMGGFGVFYKNQHQSPNPSAVMLQNFMKLRSSYKKRLADFPEGSYEYLTFDRLQLSEKVNANSLI